MEQGKVISNVKVLDLREATEESVARIARVENANIVLYTSKTAGLLQKLKIGKANLTVKVPDVANVQRVVGRTIINRDYFKDRATPSYLLVIGQIVVEPDVPAEEIERGLTGMIVTGQLLCPENLAGLLQSKAQEVVGQTATYPALDQVKIGSLILDERYLDALEDGTELAVTGALTAPDVLPNQLLEQKLGLLYVRGEIVCHEENAQTLQARLHSACGKLKIVPAGYRLVEKPILLDNALLGALPVDGLYCSERVHIDAEVTAETLSKSLRGLICEEIVLCPAALTSVLPKICDPLQNQIVFYEGQLWLVEDEENLQTSNFEHLEGKATLVVFGHMTVDPEIAPAVLAERLSKVHNLGHIECTPAQMGAIKSRLGLQSGMLQDSIRKQPLPEDGESNFNVYTL